MVGTGGQSGPGTPATVDVGGVTVVVGPSAVAIGTVTVVPYSGGSGSGWSGSGSGGNGSGDSSAGTSDGSGGSGSGSSGGSGGSGDTGSSGSYGGSENPDGSGGGLNTVLTQGGETFTVNPSQVIGPGTTISIPTMTGGGGGVFVQGPTPTVVDGVSLAVGNGVAIVGASTYAIGADAPEETIVVNNTNISIGPGGVGFADATITAAAVLPTNVIVYDVEVYSVIGASVAVFDGSSFTFTGGALRTTVFNGDTITAGPSGFIDGSSTLGGPGHPTGTQYGLAGGIAISEIGSSMAVIDGTTLTVGPGATETTATIESHTITAGPSGLNIEGTNGGSTTLDYPFNPTTQEVTAGGITFSEIGSSLIDLGGTTFTIGPGATPTTDVYDGQTISIGPGGLGFATTTISSFTTSSPLPTTTKKKSGAAASKPRLRGLLGACIALGVGILF